ncbi:MAG: NUDIX domain-containing protein [Candidatus Poribacteria bacterium]|nr:NUDIX domain-containing protein [Candidatus Poribacteria bacterium]
MISHHVTATGPSAKITWMPLPFQPPRELTTQAYAICFTADGNIVLVSGDDAYWNLPGGHPAQGETLEEALAREVWEEACAEVKQCTYIGCQKIDEPNSREGLPLYYQTRFWARVELYPFRPQFETTQRRLVPPAQFLSTLAWGDAPIAKILLDNALSVEQNTNS